MRSSNKVVVGRCATYDREEVAREVARQIEALGGVGRFLKKGKNVVVKPNLVMRKNADFGATTHPAVVEAVCALFVRAGANVTVAESSGGLYNPTTMALTFKTCGIAEACERSGAKLCADFGETTAYREENAVCKTFSVLNPIKEADVIVDVCKLKTHTIATMSGAVKNMFGVVPGIQKVEMHARFPEMPDFADMLVDLSLTVTPDLCVMDAVDAMEGNGPTAGVKTHVGAILSSDDPFCLDAVAARLARIGDDLVPTIGAARRRGIDDACPVEGEALVGELSKALALPDTKETRFETVSTIFGGRLKRYLAPRPAVSAKRCRGCGECVKKCPEGLISIVGNKARIRRDGCIRCFCCHELCPHQAIDIKKPLIARI